MSTFPVNGIKACSVAAWSGRRDAAGTTTVGWQDKRPHIVRRSVGCFDSVFSGFPHLAAPGGNVCCGPKSLYRNSILHIEVACRVR